MMLPAQLAVEGLRTQLKEKIDALKKRLKELKEQKEKQELLAAKDALGNTLLHDAVANGPLKIIQELLVLGLPIDEPGAQKKTVLHLAVEQGLLDVVHELVGWGASLDKRDAGGKTALEFAETRAETGDATYKKIAALLRTRQTWQAEAVGFRFNRVVHLIQEVFPKIQTARGRDKLLFIGGTGSGKSTLLNYLCGAQYETGFEEETGEPFARLVAGVDVAETGHGMVSQTLYPQVIKREGSSLVYCDLAGLFENRGAESSICATSSIQLLSRLPGGIGIVVALEMPGFHAARGETFKKTAIALTKIVKGQPKLLHSVCFVLTKVPPRVRLKPEAIVRAYISPLIESLGRGGDSEEQALAFMLRRMERRPDTILISNPADEGQSRKIIEEFFVAKLETQKPEAFSFIHHDEAQRNFNAVLSTIAGRFLDSRSNVEERLPKLLREEQEKQRALAANILALEQQIASNTIAAQQPCDLSSFDREIADKTSKIKDYQAEHKVKHEKIKTNNEKINELLKVFRQLNTADRITLHEETCTTRAINPHGSNEERVTCVGEINYIPPAHIKSFSFSESWVVKPYLMGESRREYGDKTRYYIRITSLIHPATLKVTFFTTKAMYHSLELDKLRAEIIALDSNKNGIAVESAGFESDIARLSGDIEVCRARRAAEEQAKIRERERLLAENERLQYQLIEKRAEQKQTAEREGAIRKEIEQLNIELEVNRKLFELVYEISRILDLREIPRMLQLWEQYPAYKASHPLQTEPDLPGGPAILSHFNALTLTPAQAVPSVAARAAAPPRR